MGSLGPPCCHEQHRLDELIERPIFHVASRSGWVNDPNAPLYWKGRYHLFYQHVGQSTSWTWGLCWGHASSADLVHWQHHQPALTPTDNSPDQDGCFSGCAAILPADNTGITTRTATKDRESKTPAEAEVGTSAGGQVGSGCCAMPVLLYTGVVRRRDAPQGLRPSSVAVSELCIEKQMAAVPADPDDPYLLQWIKVPEPWLATPPAGICLNCFRDPFVLESPSSGNSNTWQVMIGAGIRDPDTGLACAGDTGCSPGTHMTQAAAADSGGSTAADHDTIAADAELRRAAAGTALVYRSKNLLSGWEFVGHLCTAGNRDTDGVVWECPVMAQLPALQPHDKEPGHGSSAAHSARTHMFSVSTGRSPAIYWLGQYTGGRFDLTAAAGPYPLDLGDLLYAPNVLTNSPGGVVLWGWLSELPNPGGSHDYAGCISLPRLLHITPEGHLHQQPLPQLSTLHKGPAYQEQQLQLGAGESRHIGSTVPSSYFDLQLTLAPAGATTGTAEAEDNDHRACAAGIILPAWSSSSTGAATNDAAATVKEVVGQGVLVLYDFSSSKITVVVGDQVEQDLMTSQPAANSTSAVEEYIEAAKDAAAAAAATGSKTPSAAGVSQELRILGGQLRLPPQQPLKLRLLMDYSLLEVFTGDGQVLSTRVYRGLWPAGLQQEPQHAGGSAAEVHTDPAAAPVNAAGQDSGGRAMHAAVAADGPCDGRGLGEGSAAASAVGAAPCGCYLFAHGAPVAVEGIYMSAMGTAWLA